MKIAIVGNGKMGKEVATAAITRGHEIVCIIDIDNQSDFSSEEFHSADVAIEFTRPESAKNNILRCFDAGIPVVSGTTGWTDSLDHIKKICAAGKGTLLWASNFSVGVNIFLAANRYLTRLMEKFGQYEPSIHEIHHTAKLDHPSGTAITLAEQTIANLSRKQRWTEPDNAKKPCNTDLVVSHERITDNPGTHIIRWESANDEIELSHYAKSRAGFAIGAVISAEWISGKTGFFTIADIFNFE